MTQRQFAFSIALAALILFPLFAAAQTNSNTTFVPLANYQGSQLQDVFGSNTLSSYLNGLFQLSITIGAMLAVIMIVYGGYLYMFKDSFSIKQNAKQKITDAIIGLLLLLGIYLILFQINPDILNLNVLNGDFQSSGNYQNTGPQAL